MKAAIFDLDGTLTDSLADIVDACNHALTLLGHNTFTLDEYKYLAGGGNKKLITRVLTIALDKQPDDALVQKAIALKMGYENGPTGHVHLRPFPHVHQMLRDLQSAGLRIAILSNKVETNVRNVVSHLFPDVDFVYVAGARDDTPLKPDPTAALKILKDSMPGVQPTECVFVGDTDIDMITGKAAGMTSLGVSWGFRPEAELIANGATMVATHAQQITDFLITGKAN